MRSAQLVIGPAGKVTGDIVCLNADIEGTVAGTIKVDGVLLLKSTAVFNGNIVTTKLGVENGAEFTGTCSMNGNSAQKTQDTIPVEKNESELVY